MYFWLYGKSFSVGYAVWKLPWSRTVCLGFCNLKKKQNWTFDTTYRFFWQNWILEVLYCHGKFFTDIEASLGCHLIDVLIALSSYMFFLVRQFSFACSKRRAWKVTCNYHDSAKLDMVWKKPSDFLEGRWMRRLFSLPSIWYSWFRLQGKTVMCLPEQFCHSKVNCKSRGLFQKDSCSTWFLPWANLFSSRILLCYSSGQF